MGFVGGRISVWDLWGGGEKGLVAKGAGLSRVEVCNGLPRSGEPGRAAGAWLHCS